MYTYEKNQDEDVMRQDNAAKLYYVIETFYCLNMIYNTIASGAPDVPFTVLVAPIISGHNGLGITHGVCKIALAYWMPKKREKYKNKENNMVQPPFQYECCKQHWKEFLLTSE